MTTSRLEYLVQQTLAGTATPQEWEEFQQLVMQQEQSADLEQALENNWQQFQPTTSVPSAQLNTIYETLMQQKDTKPATRIIPLRKWAWVAAASVLLISSAGVVYFMNAKKEPNVVHTPAAITPGKDGAILTLADGRKIVLDSLGNGVVSHQSGTAVVLQNSQLIYETNNHHPSLPVSYNTLSTPKGRQFRITLPDGSRVWLNAASSLKFPTSFTAAQREVFITGEAYLEVAQDQKTPFIVKAGDVGIKVLGTTFNINAYPDEAMISTTLVEGKVQITNGTETQTLQPGQQLMANNKNGITLNKNVDVDQVIAWKNGYFNFEGVGIQTLMRQLERWYDIEVKYPEGIPAIQFVGKMSRNVKLPDLLEGLKGAGVNFRIENNRQLIVLP